MAAVSNPPNLKTPVRPMQRGPLAQQIERQLTLRAQLFSDPLLPLRDVAVALGNLSYSTIRKLIKDGELPTVRIGRRGHHKVRMSVVREMLTRGDRP